MRRKAMWIIGTAPVLCLVVATLFAGCGGHREPGTSLQPGRMGEMVLTVDWNRTRLIPPDTTTVVVTITGDGLANPVVDTITRPANQSSVSKVYELPVGFKRITAEAKDASGRTLASGTGQAHLNEGQRSNVEIVMAEVTARTVLVRIRGEAPTFAAYQDGDGAWQTLPPNQTEYRLTVHDPAGRYGVLAVLEGSPGRGADRTSVHILHATVDEVPAIETELDGGDDASRVAVSGTVLGITPPEVAQIAIGDATGVAFQYYGYAYSLSALPGTHDVCASLSGGFHGSASKLFIRRNVPVLSEMSMDIDFNSADAFDLGSTPLTIQGVGAGEIGNIQVFLRSNTGTTILLHGAYQTPLTDTSIATVPSQKLQGNDIHQLLLMPYDTEGSRQVFRYFKSVDSLTVGLPAPIGEVVLQQVATDPYLRLQAQWQAYAGAQGYFLNFMADVPRSRSRGRTYSGTDWSVALTTGWLGGQTNYTIPDFSGLTGWNNAWGLQRLGYLQWRVAAFTSNRSVSDAILHESNAVDGLELRLAGREGSLE